MRLFYTYLCFVLELKRILNTFVVCIFRNMRYCEYFLQVRTKQHVSLTSQNIIYTERYISKGQFYISVIDSAIMIDMHHY